MSAPAMPFGQPRPDSTAAAPPRALPLEPAEGWLTVVLVAILGISIAWSVDDARWIFGRPGLTPFLIPASLLGSLYGFLSAKAGWSRRRALPLGALAAALLLPMMVGSVLAPGEDVFAQFGASAHAVIEAYLDVAWRGRATTAQYAQWLLVFGILAWGTGWWTAWTTFHHRRPINAVMLSGAVLVASMSLTINDQFPVLVVFSLAALLLLIRMHAFEERSTWLRHQVWRAGSMGAPYLRGGLLFVALAVTGAVALTATASSAPLAGAFSAVNDRLIEVGRQFQGILPQGGPSRIVGSSFGPSLTISGTWTTDDSPVLQIQVPDDTPYHWRAIAYDRFTGTGWTQSGSVDQSIAAGAKVLGATTEGSLAAAGRRETIFLVRPLDSSLHNIISPDSPVSVDRATTLTAVDQAGRTFFASLSADGTTSYRVTASVIELDPTGAHGLTANQLRAARQDYPAELRTAYTEIRPGTVGADSRALLSTILARVPQKDPYDVARAIETYLRDPANFHYDTNVSDVDCAGRSVVDCFVFSRRGYCEHYASLMTMLLRVEGIPARMVEGYLPSRPDTTGWETIRRNQAHAWVEAYFPGYGWIEFDPTGQVGISQQLPAGPSVAPPTPAPSGSAVATDNGGNAGRRPNDERNTPPGGAGGTSGGGDTGSLGLIVAGLLLAAGVAAAAAYAYRRSERTLPNPDSVYRGVTRFARRLGYGPRPTETVFEYMGALGDLVPVARPELQTVAAAKVEVAYGRRELGEDRLRALRDAQRRLRLSLLRLLVRRRRGAPRGPRPRR
ncbi:MAG TPA: transglutaminaseTgpA domain-containing protein [Candidatus Limnocylindrales bacterium]